MSNKYDFDKKKIILLNLNNVILTN